MSPKSDPARNRGNLTEVGRITRKELATSLVDRPPSSAEAIRLARILATLMPCSASRTAHDGIGP